MDSFVTKGTDKQLLQQKPKNWPTEVRKYEAANINYFSFKSMFINTLVGSITIIDKYISYWIGILSIGILSVGLWRGSPVWTSLGTSGLPDKWEQKWMDGWMDQNHPILTGLVCKQRVNTVAHHTAASRARPQTTRISNTSVPLHSCLPAHI